MKAIVCVDSNWGIGNNGKLLFHLKRDMKIFKTLTRGNTVVMGRKTFESLPNQSPLLDRINIVLSSDNSYNPNGVIVIHSIDKLYKEINIHHSDNVYIIGGQRVYEQLLPACTAAYITKVDACAEHDTVFPNLDNIDTWSLNDETPIFEEGQYRFKVCEYIQKNPRIL